MIPKVSNHKEPIKKNVVEIKCERNFFKFSELNNKDLVKFAIFHNYQNAANNLYDYTIEQYFNYEAPSSSLYDFIDRQTKILENQNKNKNQNPNQNQNLKNENENPKNSIESQKSGNYNLIIILNDSKKTEKLVPRDETSLNALCKDYYVNIKIQYKTK
ncbi:hypothetical protein TRFO_36254 [Tritrichomonas foetus]|uniref:Uncharacterized protein n=1 Tax=Tritrichomonas foetus TaxID=1144522 RepID=A0A1J4JIZ8_9EUKA|nr:hypothetical protein TRFO_36254 [Tritrichomonas foetus]|eukprot:OHS97531.1 hypothetical protein TRFO_36254 [Tritrichomonas foetus]